MSVFEVREYNFVIQNCMEMLFWQLPNSRQIAKLQGMPHGMMTHGNVVFAAASNQADCQAADDGPRSDVSGFSHSTLW